MRAHILLPVALLAHALLLGQLAHAASGVYAGGPVYRHKSYAISELKSSGFTHVIVWTIHIEEDGSLGFNGEFPVVRDGAYIGDNTYPEFTADVASLKTGSTSISRVEFGLSAAGSGTYRNVKALLACGQSHCGIGPGSILFRNFRALREAFPTVDALNNDDESTYDLASAVPFHVMLADIGFNTAIVPYTRKSFWQAFVNQVNDARPGSVDLTYLQAYAGGSGNSPCNWNLGIPVFPGLWSRDDSASEVQSRIQSWKNSCGIQGSFMWLYDDFDNSPQVAAYANAINTVFDGDPDPEPISLFQHCSYDGYQVQLGVGSYTTAELQALGVVDNDVSSIRVAAGHQITIYQHDKFTGHAWTLTEDDVCINNNSEGRDDGSDWNDDLSSVVVAKAGDPPDDSVLENGVPKTALGGEQGAELRYSFAVPANQTSVSVRISGGSGDADLYVNHGSPPTVAAGSSNDCRPYRWGNEESCTTQLAPYTTGTYHVLLHGYSSFSGVTLVAEYGGN